MKKYFYLLLAIVISTALVACQGGSDNNEKEERDSIVVGIQQDLDSLDPFLATAAGTREVMFNIFEGLVKPDENGNLIPAVAESYDVSEDGSVYTFKLREGVKFHNGDVVTAEDVKYSIEYNAGLIEGSELIVSAFSLISSVNIVDPSTVEVVLSEPDTEFIGFMTVAIVPMNYDKQTEAPVGTGPFKFVSYSTGESLVMERFDDYWGEKPELKTVTFKIVTSSATAVMELQAGSIDIYPYMTMDEVDQLGDDINVIYGNTNLVQGLFINNSFEPFQNEKVRQALCYAINRQEIIDMVAGGHGTIIGSILYPGFGKYYNAQTENMYLYNVETAKELLKEAGYEDGFTFTVKVPSSYQFHMDTALVIKEQLKAIGVTMEIEGVEWATWLEDVYKGKQYEATIIGFDSNMAPKDMARRYVSGNSKNMIFFENDEYDELYARAVATTDDNEKIECYKRMQEIVAEHAGSVFIQDPAKIVAVSKDIEGFAFYPVYVLDMSKISFVK